MLKKIMGIDYGKARIGIAISDGLGMVANPVATISEKHFPSQVKAVAKTVNELKPTKIIMGLPRNMDGTEGDSATLVREFAQKLYEHTNVEIDFLDERLTTVSAHKMLSQMNVNGSKKRKGVVDTLSAVIILQNYLDKKEVL
ncbi:MAG: Holliday junction resolvase RuvX [Clostridia bacterium]|nr:Holliday junction resolvase RuvX [Clostridia bacterium]